PVLSAEERLEGLRLLPHADAEDLLLSLPARDQAELILETSAGERRSWMRLLPPADAADVVQAAPEAGREGLLALLDAPTRKGVAALLAVRDAERMDQEALSRLFAEHECLAIPVIDAERHVKGIVTVDDIVDVVQEEATEDIQKIGGMEALDAPYLEIGFASMVRKRAGW